MIEATFFSCFSLVLRVPWLTTLTPLQDSTKIRYWLMQLVLKGEVPECPRREQHMSQGLSCVPAVPSGWDGAAHRRPPVAPLCWHLSWAGACTRTAATGGAESWDVNAGADTGAAPPPPVASQPPTRPHRPLSSSGVNLFSPTTARKSSKSKKEKAQ